MDKYQPIINWILIIGVPMLASVAGWWLRQVWDALNLMKRDLQKLEVSLPTTYVNKSDFQLYTQRQDQLEQKRHDEVMNKLEAIDGKFNRVYDQISTKADK